jgi:hypothetical protein
MAGPFRNCRTRNGSGVPLPPARQSQRHPGMDTMPRCFVDRVTRPTGKDRDRANVQNKASDLWLCRAAYRNRTDDLRITRRITGVHDCPGSHVCHARVAFQSARVRDRPGSLLANPLAWSIRAVAPDGCPSWPHRAGSAPRGRTPGACAADDAGREWLLSPTRCDQIRIELY